MDLCRWERRCFSKYALSSCSCNYVVVGLATCWFLFVSVLVVSILRFAYLVAIFRIIEEVLTFSKKLARILVPCFRVGIWPTSGYSFSTWITWWLCQPSWISIPQCAITHHPFNSLYSVFWDNRIFFCRSELVKRKLYELFPLPSFAEP